MAVLLSRVDFQHPARSRPERTRWEDRHLRSSTGYGTTSAAALDRHSNRWVVCELLGAGKGLYVGRIGPRFGPIDVQLVPGTVGAAVTGKLGISAHGVAALV